MSNQPAIVWFRNDLRLSDNGALRAAAQQGPLVAVFVLDDAAAQDWRAGSASRWWLHHSLTSLGQSIADLGGMLILRRGDAATQLASIAREVEAGALYFSRAYEPWARAQEDAVHEALGDTLEVRRFSGYLLVEPETIATKAGLPYKVYTPFWKSLKERVAERPPRPAPARIRWCEHGLDTAKPDDWQLLPTQPDWAGGLRETWEPGEAAATAQLEKFADGLVADYADLRNRPDVPGTSRLSAHLHFGELNPGQVWHAIQSQVIDGQLAQESATSFLREIAWREFSSHLLFHFPTLPEKNFRASFDRFPWREAPQRRRAWQQGQTGYPIVDAGMRQLWHTGWMHNRVRMIVASFLIKHLQVHWREGQRWFWDTLVDADLANNAASWQWVAGSGADAAPYFRIFNPITQGEKFDPKGLYVRHWVPEIAGLPDKFLNRPWEAPAETLQKAGVELGTTYPQPAVDHAEARATALAAFKSLKSLS